MDKPFKTFDEQVAILNGLDEPNKRKRMNTDSNTKFYLKIFIFQMYILMN